MKKLVVFVALGLSACMGEMRNADLKTNVVVARAAEGNGAVALNVVDERPSTTVADPRSGGASIRLEEAVSLVEPSVKQALAANGFSPAGKADPADRKLKVEIRAIEFKMAGGLATASLLPSAALKAIAVNKGQTLERFYRADNPKSASMITTDEERDRLVGEALSKALSDLVNDPTLMGFLAR